MSGGVFEAAAGALVGHLVGKGVEDMVRKGKEKVSGAKDQVKKTGSSVMDFLESKEETKAEAEKIQETAQEERKGIFGDVWDSVLVRYFPTISKLKDLKSPVKIYESIKANPMNIIDEMDGILADTFFMPECVLKIATDPLIHTDIFKKLVETYDNAFHGVLTPDIPLLNKLPVVGPEKQNWKEKIYGKEDYDPDDVVDFLRIVVKDKNLLRDVVSKII